MLASVSTDNVVDVKEDGKAALFIFRTNESGEWCIKSVFTTSPPFTYSAFPHTLRGREMELALKLARGVRTEKYRD